MRRIQRQNRAHGYQLLEKIAEIRGIQLVYIEQDENKTDEQLMQEDFLALIHVYNCKTYSKRGWTKLAKPLEHDAVCRGKELLDSGISQRQAAKILTKEGFGNITAWAVRKYCGLNKALKRVQQEKEQTSIELFAERATAVDDAVRTTIPVAYQHYCEWCKAQKLTVLPSRQFTHHFSKFRQVSMQDENGKNQRTWVGIQFEGVPTKIASKAPKSGGNLEGLLAFISESKGYKGRLSGFTTTYLNWSRGQGKIPVDRTKVRLTLAQIGANLTKTDGIYMLAL